MSVVFTSMPFSHQTMIVKTDVFKKLGMYDLEYKSASDYDFVIRMIFNKCSFIFCNFTFATFRVGGFSFENYELSSNEVSSFYKKYYSKYCPISLEEAKEIYLYKVLHLGFIRNLLPYLSLKNKIKFLLYQLKVRFTIRRRNIIQFRFNGHEKFLKILGKRLI
jgi:hypothetical protein